MSDWPRIKLQHIFKIFFIHNTDRDYVLIGKGLKKIKWLVSNYYYLHTGNSKNPELFVISFAR